MPGKRQGMSGVSGNCRGSSEVLGGLGGPVEGREGLGELKERGALSRVLLRSGVAPEDARRTVRLSLGRGTTEEDVMGVVEDLRQALVEIEGDEDGK